jgi:putative transposase
MKPGTFTQIYIQLVFSPLRRESLLNPEIRSRVFEYMSGVASHLKHKPIIINGMDDHVHLFLGLNPNLSVSETVKEIKRVSSVFINQHHFFRGKFEWQNGYGGFSYSHSHIGRVYDYILNQEIHHKKRTFREEYMDLLKKFEVRFEDQYLFEFFE